MYILQRAAEKVKIFGGSEEYVVEPQDTSFRADLETEVLPEWVRRHPRRYVEKRLGRAAEKVKTFGESEKYVVELQDTVFRADLETEVLPPWVRRRPRRYVEES